MRETFPDLSNNELKTAHSFFVVRYLLSLADSVEEAHEKVRSWVDAITDTITWGSLTLGSPMRFLILEFIVEQFTGLFCPPLVSQIFGWMGAAIGFPFQSLLEYTAMKTFFHKFLGSDPTDGHASHPKARGIAKGLAFLQGGAMTAPLAVLCLQVVAV